MERKRKPGAGRKPSKPDYDAKEVLSQQMEETVTLYTTENHPSLQILADNLSLNPIKVRKLLITAGVYKSDTADWVQRVFNAYRDAYLSYPHSSDCN